MDSDKPRQRAFVRGTDGDGKLAEANGRVDKWMWSRGEHCIAISGVTPESVGKRGVDEQRRKGREERAPVMRRSTADQGESLSRQQRELVSGRKERRSGYDAM